MMVGSLPSRSNMILVRSSCPRWLIPMVRKSSMMSTSTFFNFFIVSRYFSSVGEKTASVSTS